MRLPALYHYTCDHGRDGIAASGVLRPQTHPFMRGLGPLLWLTDLEAPTPEAVGLTSARLTCDRLAHRYLVRSRAVTPWSEVRNRAPRDVVVALESYGAPAHWWVARRLLLPSEFTLDATYARFIRERSAAR